MILIQQGGLAELSMLERIAVDWIRTWMDQGGSPVAVFNRVTKGQGQAYTAYDSLESKQWVEPGIVKKTWPSCYLTAIRNGRPSVRSFAK